MCNLEKLSLCILQIQDISEQPQMHIMNEHTTIDTSQPLAISTGDSESQEGQVTAEVVQADLPSPGKIRDFVKFTTY